MLKRRKGLPYSRIIKKPTSVDAERMAEMENSILMSGKQVYASDGEDHETHLRSHKATRMRYDGIEQQVPEVMLLDRHISSHQQLMSAPQAGPRAPMPMEQEGEGPMMEASQSENAGPGEEAGNEIAAAIGGQMGGAPQ